ncbi:hypothetical protein [Polaromonas sp.]|uniref:hypothetical protein n=1 Tax=Polaromonas sp. TaxID=1869339 RepID=UPI003267E216
MATAKQAKVKRLNMAERAQQQMELHFKGFPAVWIWQRKVNDGYTTLPRTLPIAMQAIDDETKGRPAGHTLFCLWARSPDHPMLVIENPATYASEAGFSGERAVDTWRKRMKQLVELNFIRCVPGPSGDFHYVLLLNPNTAVEQLRAIGKIQQALYARFIDRVNEIGAQRDVAALREYWEAQKALNAEEAKKAAEADKNRPPPPVKRKRTTLK